ncbi:hypothetical protein EYR40_002506 [Pleurotus pulmonarius]|nr:hypothetical protein EYR40_002506 [Pleurotus pulmonarius]
MNPPALTDITSNMTTALYEASPPSISSIWRLHFVDHREASPHDLFALLRFIDQYLEIGVITVLRTWNDDLPIYWHYIDAIKQLGSLDGYNSESPERLHIDFAKEAYRASNRRDFLEQMAIWLQRREAINIRCSFIQWLHGRLPSLLEHPPESLAADAAASAEDEQTPSDAYSSTLHTVGSYRIAKTAPFRRTVSELETLHGATDFLPALTAYLEQVNPKSRVVPSSYDRFNTYKKITVDLVANRFLSSETRTSQIRATCALPRNGRKKATPAHFDTALVVEDLGSYKAKGGIIDQVRVAQIRAIFALPPQFGSHPTPLAYVEWFTPLHRFDPTTGMVIDPGLTAENVLDNAPLLYLNSHFDISLFSHIRL